MDWLRHGWGEDLSSTFDKKLNFFVDFSPLKETVSMEVEPAALLTIEKITKKYPGPYYLMISGGIDSQSMLWYWVKSGKPFTPVFVKYTHENEIFNSHELTSLNKVIDHHQLDVKFVNFDVIDFVATSLSDYATTYYCSSPQICTYMAMSELLNDGTVIFSGDCDRIFTHPRRNRSGRLYQINYTIAGLWRYQQQTKRNFVPFFFSDTPELTLALATYYNNAPYNSHKDLSVEPRHSYRRRKAYASKVKCIQDLGINLFPQERKFSGFEQIKDYYDEAASDQVTPADKLRFCKEDSNRTFDILFRYRIYKHIPYKDTIRFII